MVNKILRSAFIVMLVVWMSIMAYFYSIQDKMIFIPQAIKSEEVNKISSKFSNCEDITYTTPDNIKLHGWLIKDEENTKSPLIIYFGGNAEEVSYFLKNKNNLKGWSILAINYRGYGTSEGKPNEKNLFNDSVFIYDNIIKRTDIDTSKIVVIGRSLGSGVASYLASQRKLIGVILVTPYDSITNVAQRMYPYIPVRILLKERFDSIKLAPKIHIPALILVAQNDNFIPYKHSNKLAKKWGGQNKLEIIKDVGHNDIELGQGYWEYINNFLNKGLGEK